MIILIKLNHYHEEIYTIINILEGVKCSIAHRSQNCLAKSYFNVTFIKKNAYPKNLNKLKNVNLII